MSCTDGVLSADVAAILKEAEMGGERPELGYYVEQFRDMLFRNDLDKARDLNQALFETMGLGVI